MDENALTRLSPEQTAALSDDLKAVFTALSPADQDFFARSFKPADLAVALARKGAILQRAQAERERQEQRQSSIAAAETAAHPLPPEPSPAAGVLAGAVGLGAAAALVASDNTAHYQGVAPQDLIAPLRAEFDSRLTAIAFAGRPEALVATISLRSGTGLVPALTVALTGSGSGLDIQVNDLTSQGLLETIRQGGMRLLGAAGAGLDLMAHARYGGLGPADLARLLQSGTSLAEAAGALQLKERAWKALRGAAESGEAGYLARLEEERKAQALLEKAWDNYTNCPTCGVAFGAADVQCRVCGSARPQPPVRPDPRK